MRYGVLTIKQRLLNACPFEVYLLALCVLSSFSILAGVAPDANSIEALLPGYLRFSWAIGLSIGASVTIIGSLLKIPPITRIGCTLLAPTATAYGFIIIYSSGGFDSPGIVSGILVVAFGAAAAVRAVQITFGFGHQ